METIKNFLLYSPFEYNMTLAVTALLFGLFCYFVFNIAVLWHINGINKDNRKITKFPPSISQSYYLIDPRWLFKKFMWFSIACIILISQNVGYLIVGILFAIMTVNPSVNSGNIYFIPHMIGAISAITLGILLFGICYGMWSHVILTTIATVMVIIICTKNKSESKIYWIEQITLIFGLFVGFGLKLMLN